MAITIKGRTITASTDLDSLSDEEYALLDLQCANEKHPIGACPICADEADEDTIWGARSSSEYVSDLWGGWTSSAKSSDDAERLERLVQAHKVVKSFVDTFATGDLRYDVTFDPRIATAGTDLVGRKVVISPAPALDPTLTPAEAGLVLTGMAVHESAHVRYGRNTANAVRKAFGGDPAANQLSNLLDDVRIERRFAADYPGFSGVFEPTIAYVAKSARDEYVASPNRPLDFAIAAIRYADHVTFAEGSDTERTWWTTWADKWSATDSPSAHVDGIREAIAHIGEQAQEAQREQGGEQGEGEGGEQGAGQPTGDGQGTGQPAQGSGSIDPTSELPAELSAGVNEAARENGTQDVNGTAAQEAVNEAQTLVKTSSGDHGDIGYASRERSPRSHQYQGVEMSMAATAAIRNALLRSRTGHTGVERGMARGRCDSKSLHRIAFNDPRLFHRRSAPDPGRYLVWLMVDRSGSMAGWETMQAIAVAKAIGAAVRYTPSIRTSIFGWTSPRHNTNVAVFGAYRVWDSGEDVSKIENLGNIAEGGTPDSYTLDWAIDAIRREARPGEQPVVMMLSDGMGDTAGMRLQVERARKAGVRVVSVAIGQISEKAQERTFGAGSYITWQGSIAETARPLAVMLGKLVSQ